MLEHDRSDLALRRDRTLVGRVQHRRPRDRLLPAATSSGPAGARSRLRHRPAAAPVPPRRPRRRRLRRLGGHARALPRGRRAGGAVAEPLRPAEARARPAAPLPHDLHVRRASASAAPEREDMEALRRVYDHLEPGGTLVLDNEVPYADATGGSTGRRTSARTLPHAAAAAPGSGGPAPTAPSTSCARRLLDLDPLEQRVDHGRCARSCGATASSSPRTSTC